jgi:hypothetical protein
MAKPEWRMKGMVRAKKPPEKCLGKMARIKKLPDKSLENNKFDWIIQIGALKWFLRRNCIFKESLCRNDQLTCENTCRLRYFKYIRKGCSKSVIYVITSKDVVLE